MQFSYKAKTKDGQIIKGILEAGDQSGASLALREQNLFLINIKPVSANDISGRLFHKKVPIKDKIIFTQQLGVMIGSGISIIEGLEALREETENKNFAAQINRIVSDVQGGMQFSKALSSHPDIFDEIYINMIKAGEESGKIDLVLQRLSSQLEKEYELNRKIRGALSYPIFVLFALVAVMTLIMTFIIPQLKVIFDDAGVQLPLLTRILIAISYFLKDFGIFVLAAVIILAFGLVRFRKTLAGRSLFDRAILKIPVFGVLLKKSYMARFTRTFASLVASGLPLMDVFRVSGNVVGNIHYKNEIDRMAQKVKAGQPISATMKNSVYLPKMVGQLASVGEKSGSIDDVFDTLADFFDRDVDNITANLSTLLEPILMVFMGVGIGLIIIAVLQPIYGLVNAI